jgi:hypothetical protein
VLCEDGAVLSMARVGLPALVVLALSVLMPSSFASASVLVSSGPGHTNALRGGPSVAALWASMQAGSVARRGESAMAGWGEGMSSGTGAGLQAAAAAAAAAAEAAGGGLTLRLRGGKKGTGSMGKKGTGKKAHPGYKYNLSYPRISR